MGRERKERERRKILSTIPLFFPCGCGEKTEKRKKKNKEGEGGLHDTHIAEVQHISSSPAVSQMSCRVFAAGAGRVGEVWMMKG